MHILVIHIYCCFSIPPSQNLSVVVLVYIVLCESFMHRATASSYYCYYYYYYYYNSQQSTFTSRCFGNPVEGSTEQRKLLIILQLLLYIYITTTIIAVTTRVPISLDHPKSIVNISPITRVLDISIELLIDVQTTCMHEHNGLGLPATLTAIFSLPYAKACASNNNYRHDMNSKLETFLSPSNSQISPPPPPPPPTGKMSTPFQVPPQ